MKIIVANIRIREAALYILFWILVPSLAHAEENLERSLAEMLSYLQEKVTGSRVSFDGGPFINEIEYGDFGIDVKKKFLIVFQRERAMSKSTREVLATRWRRLTFPLAALDAEQTGVISQQCFSGSAIRVFFVLIRTRHDETAITFEGREKRGNKPKATIFGAWREYSLVFQDKNSAERLCQALVRAIKLSDSKKD